MGLRQLETIDTPEVTRTMSFRVPLDLRKWLIATKKEEGRQFTEILINAGRLDRDLLAGLSSLEGRLQVFAATTGLSLSDDLAKVLVLLIRRGLDTVEMDRPSKR